MIPARTTALLALAMVCWSPIVHAGEDSKSDGEADEFDLPPVPVDELRATAPQPSWDTGFLYSACGVGEPALWGKTKFCLGGLADVLWGRQTEKEAGAGAYGQISTAGFRDVRFSLGPSGIVSVIEWFTMSLRGGGLVTLDSDGVAPGWEGFLELGHRSVSYKSRYSVSHALFAGVQHHVARQELPAENVFWIGLRVDGLWATAPAALFK